MKTVPPAAFHRVGGNSMEGVKDVQGGTVRAGAPGLHGGRNEHTGGCPGVRSAPGYGAQDAGVLGATRVPSGVTARCPPGASVGWSWWSRTLIRDSEAQSPQSSAEPVGSGAAPTS